MNLKTGEDLRSSSPIEDSATTQKRRRLDSTDSLFLQSSADNSYCLSRINQEISNESGKQKHILESQTAVDEQTIKELEFSPMEARNSSLEFPEIGMSKETTEIKQENMKLLAENAQLKDRMIQQTVEYESGRIAAENKIIELQDKLESISSSQKDIDLQRIELEKTKARPEELTSQKASPLDENQKLLSKAASLDSLGDELKCQRSSAPLLAPLQEEVATQGQHCENLESLRQQVGVLKVKCDGLILKVMEYMKPASSKEELHHVLQDPSSDKLTPDANGEDVSPSSGASVEDDLDGTIESVPQTEQEERDLRIEIGKHSYLVSDAKYFKINWKEEYKKLGKNKFVCQRCLEESNNMYSIQDHIWCEHYGESYKCPYCEDHSKSYVLRTSLKWHMQKSHREHGSARNN